MSEKNYIVKGNIRRNGKDYTPGETIRLSKEEAESIPWALEGFDPKPEKIPEPQQDSTPAIPQNDTNAFVEIPRQAPVIPSGLEGSALEPKPEAEKPGNMPQKDAGGPKKKDNETQAGATDRPGSTARATAQGQISGPQRQKERPGRKPGSKRGK